MVGRGEQEGTEQEGTRGRERREMKDTMPGKESRVGGVSWKGERS